MKLIHNSYPKYSQEITYLDEIRFLYHYTNINSVIGILTSQSLWMTNIRTANDSSEGRLILEKSLSKIKNGNKIRSLLLNNLYTCSFSLNGNMLSQWRAYGDIAIGFDIEKIKNDSRFIKDESVKDQFGKAIFCPDSSGTEYQECQYVEIENKISELAERVDKFAEKYNEEELIGKQRILLNIGSLCFGIKHNGFSEENECRLLSFLWKKDPFKRGTTKYIEYQIKPEFVKEIIIGPSKKKSKNIDDVKDFIKKNPAYSHVVLLESGIPFKGVKKYGSYKR